MASASRTEKSRSTVRILPLNSTVSATSARAAPDDSTPASINSAAAHGNARLFGDIGDPPGAVIGYRRTVYGLAICSSGLSARSAVRPPQAAARGSLGETGPEHEAVGCIKTANFVVARSSLVRRSPPSGEGGCDETIQ